MKKLLLITISALALIASYFPGAYSSRNDAKASHIEAARQAANDARLYTTLANGLRSGQANEALKLLEGHIVATQGILETCNLYKCPPDLVSSTNRAKAQIADYQRPKKQ